jgi:hypothetical protein
MEPSSLETLEQQTAPESTRGFFDSLSAEKKVKNIEFYLGLNFILNITLVS